MKKQEPAVITTPIWKYDPKRLKIAELCGWFGPNHEETQKLVANWWSKNDDVWWLMPDKKSLVNLSNVPDYPNDLNAMHEAEKTLMPFESDKWQLYVFWLSHFTPPGGQDHATASQRADAFLAAHDRKN